jgi:hypothetical protein
MKREMSAMQKQWVQPKLESVRLSILAGSFGYDDLHQVLGAFLIDVVSGSALVECCSDRHQHFFLVAMANMCLVLSSPVLRETGHTVPYGLLASGISAAVVVALVYKMSTISAQCQNQHRRQAVIVSLMELEANTESQGGATGSSENRKRRSFSSPSAWMDDEPDSLDLMHIMCESLRMQRLMTVTMSVIEQHTRKRSFRIWRWPVPANALQALFLSTVSVFGIIAKLESFFKPSSSVQSGPTQIRQCGDMTAMSCVQGGPTINGVHI